MNGLCIVPARSGSKGIKDKNIKLLNGEPLISYTVRAAVESQYIQRVVVSTDSENYAEICRSYGAEIPFLRPAELANDQVHSVYAILHALEWLEEHERYIPDFVVMLLATSPLRTTRQVDEAIELYLRHPEGSVVSVKEADKPPQYLRQVRNGKLQNLEGYAMHKNFQRQELEKYYELNGSIYVASPDYLKTNRTYHGSAIYPYVMDKFSSVDINDEVDFFLAEYLMDRRFAL